MEQDTTGTRELCCKQVGEHENCHAREGHTGRCVATCGDCDADGCVSYDDSMARKLARS